MIVYSRDLPIDITDRLPELTATAVVDAAISEYPAEAHPDGPARGTELEVAHARLIEVRIGALVLSRNQAVDLLGREAVEQTEDAAAERAMEAVQAGDV